MCMKKAVNYNLCLWSGINHLPADNMHMVIVSRKINHWHFFLPSHGLFLSIVMRDINQLLVIVCKWLMSLYCYQESFIDGATLQ